MDRTELGIAKNAVENSIDLGWGEVLVILLVDLHHRSGAAGSEALGRAQSDHAVAGGLARVNAEPLLAVGEDCLRSPKRARKRFADPHLVTADRRGVKESVEGDH